MATRTYKLYWTNTGAGSAIASLRIARKGYITSVFWALCGVAGASNQGYRQLELSKQSTSSITVNDTPDTVLSEAAIAGNVTSGSSSMCVNQSGLRIPVEAGDAIYVHQAITNTAFSTVADTVSFQVDEK